MEVNRNMKFFYSLSIFLVLFSCKKEETEKFSLVGKWTMKSIEIKDCNDSTGNSLSECTSMYCQIWEFTENKINITYADILIFTSD